MVLASRNKHKLKEFRAILSESLREYSLLSLDSVNFHDVIPETGNTFAENALQKASIVAERLNIPVISDDSGLEVSALGGRPGVFSARFAGENATDEENNALLLKEMQGMENRKARFVASIALVWPGKGVYQVEGECSGLILEVPRGENGFGYDPLFFVPKLGKSMAEIPAEEKNKISHRRQALEKIKGILKNL